jgi:hypothetical protein
MTSDPLSYRTPNNSLLETILKRSDDAVSLLDFVHRLMFKETQRFGSWISFHPQGEVMGAPILLGSLQSANLDLNI